MRQLHFEEAHAKEWDEFEKFLDDPKKSPFAAEEMPPRYRRICQSLALAADRQYSPELVDRLNQLALRGHHALYRNRRRESQRVLEFLLAGFPALVRAERRLVLAASLLFFGPLLGLIAVLQAYPEFVHYLLAPEQIANFHQMYDPANRRLGSREADSSLMMFGFYIWNNIRIGFQTFAGGLLAGVGSIWFLAANGVVIGAVAGYLTQVGYTQTFWSFVRRPLLARAGRDRDRRRRGPAPRHGGHLAGQRQPPRSAGRRRPARGAPDVRRGDDVPRRGVRRGVLVAAHGIRLPDKDHRRHRRLGPAAWLLPPRGTLQCSPLTSR